MMKKRKILELEAGRLEIELFGNSYADISFDPDPQLCEQLAATFCKTPATDSKMDLPPNTHTKLNPAKQQNSASHELSFSELSARARFNIRRGDFIGYSKDLLDMALIVKKEGKRTDELKLRMMKFHVDLSGLEECPFIDWENVELAREAVRSSGMTLPDIECLFRNTVRDNMTPYHDFTPTGSYRMFLLSLADNRKKTGEIIDILAKCRKNH